MIINPVMYSGKKLPELVNPGTAADLLAGKQLVDQYGNPLTGTMPEVAQATPSISVDSNGLITSSATQDAGYVAAGTKRATKQLTTYAGRKITPSTSEQLAAPDGVYVTGAVTVEAMPTATQATPDISVYGATGVIIAKATQDAGYVAEGTKTSTLQLTTQSGTTITPGTSRKTAVASNRYTTGPVYVEGDPNLVASNIKSGVSIFGVTGTHSASRPTASVYVLNNTYDVLNVYFRDVVFPVIHGNAFTDTLSLYDTFVVAPAYDSNKIIYLGGYNSIGVTSTPIFGSGGSSGGKALAFYIIGSNVAVTII